MTSGETGQSLFSRLARKHSWIGVFAIGKVTGFGEVIEFDFSDFGVDGSDWSGVCLFSFCCYDFSYLDLGENTGIY